MYVQSLAKDADFSQASLCLFVEGIEEKVKNCVDAVYMLKRRSASSYYGNKQFFSKELLSIRQPREGQNATELLSTLPKLKKESTRNKPEMGTTIIGPICIKANTSATRVLLFLFFILYMLLQ